MKTDDFEKRLQRQSPRQIPAAWREEILSSAERTAASPHAPRTTHHSLRSLIHQLSTLLRPQRVAWTGLAAAWLVILVMNLASQEHSTLTAKTNSTPTLETLQALKQQRQLLAELVDRPARHETDQIKVVPIGPRSQRREETVTV